MSIQVRNPEAVELVRELARVEARRRALARESDKLRRDAAAAGVTQGDLAQVLGVTQATVSRQLSQPLVVDEVAEAVDRYELGDLDYDALANVVREHGGASKYPAVARAVLRDTVPARIIADTDPPAPQSLRERVVALEGWQRADLVHQQVLRSVDVLRARGDDQWRNLVRDERRVDTTDESAVVQFLERCEQLSASS